jgi:hypothetical protein
VLIPCLDYFLPLEFLFSSRDISPARGSQFRSGSQIQRRFVQYIDFPLRFPPVDRSRSRAGIPARFHRWFSFLPLSESVTGQFPRQVARPDSPFYTCCHYCLRVRSGASVPEDFGFARSGLALLPECVEAGFSFALKHTAVRSRGGGAHQA